MEDEAAIDCKEQPSADVTVSRVIDVEAMKVAVGLFDKAIDQSAAEAFLAAEGHHLLLPMRARSLLGWSLVLR